MWHQPETQANELDSLNHSASDVVTHKPWHERSVRSLDRYRRQWHLQQTTKMNRSSASILASGDDFADKLKHRHEVMRVSREQLPVQIWYEQLRASPKT